MGVEPNAKNWMSKRTRASPGEVNGRRHVLSIAFQFPPDSEVGARSCDQIFRHLSSCGWLVTVVTVRERDIEEPASEFTSFPYAGSLYTKRTPYPLFQALRSLIDSGEVVREHIQIDLIGRCSKAEVYSSRTWRQRMESRNKFTFPAS